MARMTGGRALVRAILAHGVDTIFAIPGVQLDYFFNALHDEGNAVRVIQTRHEQGAAYMAFGYAQSTGRVGAYAVVPGPGFLNTTAALATAYACNTRVLCVTGQIPSAHIGRGWGMLHEIPDQLGMLRGLTKWADRINYPTEAGEKVREAFRALHTGRPRPVGLEMPLDQMAREVEVTLPEPWTPQAAPPPDPVLIEKAAELLGKAVRPLIFAGSGAYGGAAELARLAEMLQAPVITHRGGRGVISDRSYLSLSQAAGHRLWADADVVLAVGSRLQQQRVNWGTDDDLAVIHIDIDPTEINRVARPAVGIVADAQVALSALLDALPAHNRERSSRAEELKALKVETAEMLADKLGPQMAYAKVLREALPEDGFLVDELTQVGYVLRVGYPVYEPRTLVTTGYQGTLGYGFATALGVKIANPDKPVLSINGDGGFMYNVQELATAVLHGIDVVAVVFCDGAYGNVRRMQRELYGGREIATKLHNPDFVAMAQSYGAKGLRADGPEELSGALKAAFAHRGPVIVEVPLSEVPEPWSVLVGGRVRPKR